MHICQEASTELPNASFNYISQLLLKRLFIWPISGIQAYLGIASLRHVRALQQDTSLIEHVEKSRTSLA
jgi:hypothetical protein